MRQFHIIVSGIVQGVGFRYFTLYLAKNYGINGWVRNLPNGDVEIMAAGVEDALERFLSKLKIGPRYSKVTNIEVLTHPIQDFQNFTIK